jgi:hypothetical protein
MADFLSSWRRRKARMRAVHEMLKASSLSPVISPSTHSSCAREHSCFFLSTLRKSFTEAGHLCAHEKSKQHQLRLMNVGVDDDFFFFNNNNQQRQLTISTNSLTTTSISMPTMHKIIHCKTFYSSSRRGCAVGDSTSMSELQEHVLVEGALVDSPSPPERRFSAIDVESVIVIGWPRAQGVAYRGRFGSGTSSGSICMRIRASTAATTLRRRPMFALTFSPITSTISHSQSQ